MPDLTLTDVARTLAGGCLVVAVAALGWLGAVLGAGWRGRDE